MCLGPEGRRSARARLAGAAAWAVLPLALQGCGKGPGCKIQDVYAQLQVNGRTGFNQDQLKGVGVWLCARHSGKQETYRGEEACSKPEEVFADGELPDIMVGDVREMLLVRCPSSTYPGTGEIKQRVTCGKDYYFDDPDGPMKEELAIYFDTGRKSMNCQVDDDAGRLAEKNATRLPEEARSGTEAVSRAEHAGVENATASPEPENKTRLTTAEESEDFVVLAATVDAAGGVRSSPLARRERRAQRRQKG
mmetsp:Transcript_103084/g.274072  ORF Transcript_103084/g.274072 Transcript_103084/m.274072 type:complete len:250 (-) Transcript_103084:60-809(-)